MFRLEPLLEVFKAHDASSTGYVTKDELVVLLRKLDSTWTKEQGELFLRAVGHGDTEHVPYESFLGWIFSSVDTSGITGTSSSSHEAIMGPLTEQEHDWIRLGGTELETPIANDWVKLVRADYLVELAKSGGKLKRRQELPPEAFVGLDELQQAGAARLAHKEECLRVIVLSYPWLQPGHPDPHGENLCRIAQVLGLFVEFFAAHQDCGLFGILIDFTALPQAPRTEDEEEIFKLALPALNVFYSHPQTVVLKVTEFPAGYPDNPAYPYDLPEGSNRVQYAERGWCFAESAMSSLVKSSSKVLDVGCTKESIDGLSVLIRHCRTKRNPPLHPDDFKAKLNKKTFTSKRADFEKVVKLYVAAFEHRFGSAVELDYHGLKWGADAARTLALALPSNRSLQVLNLFKNKIGSGGAAALGQVLQTNSSALRSLNLRGNGIGSEGAAALGHALRTNSSLQSLDLTHNSIGLDGAAALGQALQTNNGALQSLNLAFNSIRSEGAVALGQGLQTNCTLQLLDLQDNCITAEGAMALGQALQTNRALQSLNLWGNSVGAEGAAALGQALENNSGLLSLKLVHNRIKDDGAVALGRALQKNSSLQSLELALNRIGAQGATALGQALQTNCLLQQLDLRHNKIGDKGAVALAQALQINGSLQGLDLFNNDIGARGAAALAQALQGNSSLRELNLHSNARIGQQGWAVLREVQQAQKKAERTCHVIFDGDTASGESPFNDDSGERSDDLASTSVSVDNPSSASCD